MSFDTINSSLGFNEVHKDSEFGQMLGNTVVTNPVLTDEEAEQIDNEVNIDTDVDQFVSEFNH